MRGFRFGLLSAVQGTDEFFGRDRRLAQNARQRSDLYLGVHRHDTALRLAAHDDVAPALPDFREPQMFESTDDLRA